MATYTAASLEDIAASFDHYAWQETAFSDRLHKTQRAKLLAQQRHDTWRRAAEILRSTTITATRFPYSTEPERSDAMTRARNLASSLSTQTQRYRYRHVDDATGTAYLVEPTE